MLWALLKTVPESSSELKIAETSETKQPAGKEAKPLEPQMTEVCVQRSSSIQTQKNSISKNAVIGTWTLMMGV